MDDLFAYFAEWIRWLETEINYDLVAVMFPLEMLNDYLNWSKLNGQIDSILHLNYYGRSAMDLVALKVFVAATM